MKKMLSVLLLLTLALTASCAEETNTVSSEAPVSSASVSSAPVQSETTQTGFSLESLPDIGEYAGVKPTYFYGEPLDEFRPSDEYGTLVPYCVGSSYGDNHYGFLSSDGRVITSPCYLELHPCTMYDGSQSVYIAYLSTRYPKGVSWEEAKLDLSSYAIISVDGSRYTVIDHCLPEDIYFLSDPTADALMFGRENGVELYDFEGNRIASLPCSITYDLSDIQLVREGKVYRLYYTDGQRDANFSVCTFDGKTQSIRDVSFDREDVDFFLGLYGDVILAVGNDGYVLSDLNGHVLFSLPDNIEDCDICRRADGSYIAAAKERIDFLAPDGALTETVKVPYELWFDRVTIDDAAGEIRFVSDEGTVTYSLRDGTFTENLSVNTFEIDGEKDSLVLRRSDGKEISLSDYTDAWVECSTKAFVLLRVSKDGVNRYLVYDADTLTPVSVPYVDGAQVEVVKAANGKTYFSCHKNGAVTVLDETLEIVGVVPVTVTD